MKPRLIVEHRVNEHGHAHVRVTSTDCTSVDVTLNGRVMQAVDLSAPVPLPGTPQVEREGRERFEGMSNQELADRLDQARRARQAAGEEVDRLRVERIRRLNNPVV